MAKASHKPDAFLARVGVCSLSRVHTIRNVNIAAILSLEPPLLGSRGENSVTAPELRVFARPAEAANGSRSRGGKYEGGLASYGDRVAH